MAYNPSWRLTHSLRCELCLGFQIWVLFILVVACCTEWTNSRNSWHSLISSLSGTFSPIQGCDELRPFVNVLVSIISLLTVRFISKRSYCTFSKCSFSFTHYIVSLYSFIFAKFFELSSKFCSLVDPVCLVFFFGIFFGNARKVSLGSFVFASTVLSNRSWRTSGYFIPFLSSVSFSTYAKSIHQVSFWIWQMHSYRWTELICGKSKFFIGRFWMQKLSPLWYWQIACFH